MPLTPVRVDIEIDDQIQPKELNRKLPRILIVEDNPDMVNFLTGILEKKYNILTAKNGLEGLEMAREHSLDLILSDIMMPEMDT